MKCMNVMQCKPQKQKQKQKKQKQNKTKTKTKTKKKQTKQKTKQNQGTMITKGRAMKHKDHVRKTQLVRVFCIQNLLDVP